MNPKARNDLSSLTSEQAYERIRRDLERSAFAKQQDASHLSHLSCPRLNPQPLPPNPLSHLSRPSKTPWPLISHSQSQMSPASYPAENLPGLGNRPWCTINRLMRL